MVVKAFDDEAAALGLVPARILVALVLLLVVASAFAGEDANPLARDPKALLALKAKQIEVETP